MIVETAPEARTGKRVRLEPVVASEPHPRSPARLRLALAVCAIGLGLVGGGNLEPGPIESKLAMTTWGKVGAYGDVYGGWEPGLLPGKTLEVKLWSLLEGSPPTDACVRWPALIATLLAGVALAASLKKRAGDWTGLWALIGWCACLGVMDHSELSGLDPLAGVWTVAAVVRMMGPGADGWTGLLTGLACLGGGWPPLAVLVIASVLLGRREAAIGLRFVVPVAIIFAGWSAWALKTAPLQAWAGALTLPFTEKSAWLMGAGILAAAFPWTPFAIASLAPFVKRRLDPEAGGVHRDWARLTIAFLIAGTVVPGLSSAFRLPALAGMIALAALALGVLYRDARALSRGARLAVAAMVITVAAIATVMLVPASIYLALVTSYYRQIGILLAAATPLALLVAIDLACEGRVRGGLLCVVGVAVLIKLGHWGMYVPEKNYRMGQGAYGRAIGQWVPPKWPIYITEPWPADLMFQARRPVQQIPHPLIVKFLPDQEAPKFLLLHPQEFAHWPRNAPEIEKVFTFYDEFGDRPARILARTKGYLFWRPPGSKPIKD